MHRITAIALVLSIASLAACATVSAPSTDHLTQNKTAFVKGADSSMFSLGSTFDIRIKSVDGASTWNSMHGYSDGLELPEGKHSLVILCAMTAEVGNVHTQPVDSSIEADLVAGHVYQLEPGGQGESGGCAAKMMDVTGQAKP